MTHESKHSTLVMGKDYFSYVDNDAMQGIVHYMEGIADIVRISLTCWTLLQNVTLVNAIHRLTEREACILFSSHLRHNDFAVHKTVVSPTSYVLESFYLPGAYCRAIYWSDIKVTCAWTKSMTFHQDGVSCLRPIITQLHVLSDENIWGLNDVAIYDSMIDKEFLPISAIRQICPWFLVTHPIFSFKGSGVLSFQEYGGAIGNSSSNTYWRQIEHLTLEIPVFAGKLTLKGDIVFRVNPRLHQGDISNTVVCTYIHWKRMELSVW